MWLCQMFLSSLSLRSSLPLSLYIYTHTYIHTYLYIHAKLLQSCLTLCDSTDCSLLGFSVHGILQASILDWVAMPPPPGDLPNPGIESVSPATPAFQADSLPLSHREAHIHTYIHTHIFQPHKDQTIYHSQIPHYHLTSQIL